MRFFISETLHIGQESIAPSLYYYMLNKLRSSRITCMWLDLIKQFDFVAIYLGFDDFDRFQDEEIKA